LHDDLPHSDLAPIDFLVATRAINSSQHVENIDRESDAIDRSISTSKQIRSDGVPATPPETTVRYKRDPAKPESGDPVRERLEHHAQVL
jgi:hypothetical protein